MLASSFGTKSEGYKLCRPATKTFSGIKMFRKKSGNVMIGECYRNGEQESTFSFFKGSTSQHFVKNYS